MNLMKYSMTVVVAGAMMIVSTPVSGQDSYLNNQSQQLEFNLFQNYYTPQGPSMATAGMYNAPHPVPYWVGGSHYTYQPFYPHQHLYTHKKNYYNYYGSADQFYSDNLHGGRGGAALNKTTVIWKGTGYHFGNFPMSSYPAQKLKYAFQAHKYGLRGNAGYGYAGGTSYGGDCATGGCN